MFTKLSYFALFLFFLLLSCPTFGDNPDSVSNPENEADNVLSVDVSSSNEVDFKLSNEKVHVDIHSRIRTNISTGLDLRFSYEGSSTSFELYLKFLDVVFYTPSSAPGFQAGVNTVVADYLFSSMTWLPIVCNKSGNNFQCTVQSTSYPSITMVVHLVAQTTGNGNVTYTPNSIKFDVNIQKNISSSVALRVRVEGQQSVDSQVEDGANADVQGVTVSQTGNFTWVKTWNLVYSDGSMSFPISIISSNSPANATNDFGEEDSSRVAREFVFSFENSGTGTIYWDPWIGGTSSGFVYLPSLFLLILSLLFALL